MGFVEGSIVVHFIRKMVAFWAEYYGLLDTGKILLRYGK